MQSFIAIDVETANYESSSICSVGCIKVRDGVVTDSYYSLVHPEPGYYIRRFTAIHGLCDDDTWDAPPFDKVWSEILEWSEGLPFVAHNASFDWKCIASAARIYQMDTPPNFYCTLRRARAKISRWECPSKSLPNLCQFFGIDFNNHHHALSDAEACARLALILFDD